MGYDVPDFLGALPPRLREAAADLGVRRQYGSGDVVFHQGDPGETLHVITAGFAGVGVVTRDGRSLLLNVLLKGQTFGEVALAREDGVRTATVRAITDLETLSLRRRDLAQLRHLDAAFDRLLMSALASHVDRLSTVLIESRRATLWERTVRRLAQLCPPAEAGSVVLPLNQEELGAFVGVTRQAINGVLRRLEEQGHIERSWGRVRVVDSARLRRLAAELVI